MLRLELQIKLDDRRCPITETSELPCPTMSLIHQVTLLAAGAQPWHIQVCTAQKDYFAYAATQAIYIYRYEKLYNEFKLHSIMSEHKKTICAIQWHPSDEDILASSSLDHCLIIWHVTRRSLLAILETSRAPPSRIGWCLRDKEMISYLDGRGPLFTWRYSSDDNQPTVYKDSVNFQHDVSLMRWHPKSISKIVFGHINGSLSLLNQSDKPIRHASLDEQCNDENNSVIALEWDPLSTDYLLVAHHRTGIRLVDTSEMKVVTSFVSPSTATTVKTLGWLPDAPGMFVTGDTQSGVLRVWSVAKSSPIENIKLKHVGFHVLLPITTRSSSSNQDEFLIPDSDAYPLQVEAQSKSFGTQSQQRYTLPPAHIVCLFLDGGVGLYNLTTRKWDFSKEMGHIETIFDCKFKPSSCDLFASGSFDGSIKVWNINTMEAEYSSIGNESIIYCVSWAPADLDCIAAATARNGVIIWKLNKSTVIKNFMEHGDHHVYSVAWNQLDSRRIASGGGDHNCIVRHADGTVCHTILHPGVVFGCDWMPTDKDVLATACGDGIVRVFELSDEDYKTRLFTGHSAKAFQVKWNPLKTGIFCSSSDDESVRVWDYSSETCLNVLRGHTSHVRALVWSPEIPYLLFSGSWDSTIRAWDARDGSCLDAVFDHGADVYGLTIHPFKPFILVSSSRDSTMRVWSTAPLTPLLPLYIITKQPWNEIIGFADRGYCLGGPTLLCGRQSVELKSLAAKQGEAQDSTIMQFFSEFFSHSWGVANLWDLVMVIQGQDPLKLTKNYRKAIVHSKHLVKMKTSEAQELEMTTSSRFGHKGLGAPGREDCLRAAAEIQLRVGNLHKYCDLLVQLGQWEQALAIAPAVSLKYWKDLATKRMESLMQEKNELALAYGVAVGDVPRLVEFSLKRKQVQEAYLLAAAAKEGAIRPMNKDSADSDKESRTKNGPLMENIKYMEEVMQEMADKYFQNGSPVHAACCHLAIDDIQGALLRLLRGHELELAVSIGLVLGKENEVVSIALRYLARKCERLGEWELAVKVLQLLPGNETDIWLTCARCSTSLTDQEALHKLASLPSRDKCLSSAMEYLEQDNWKEALRLFLLSSEQEKALEIGLQRIKEIFESDDCVAPKVWEIIQLLGAVRTEKLQAHKNIKSLHELLIIAAYVGALMAIRKQYYPVVTPLFEHACILLKRYPEVEVPAMLNLVESEVEIWKLTHQQLDNRCSQSCLQSYLSSVRRSEAQQIVFDRLLAKAGKEDDVSEIGVTIVTGSHLPTHSDTHPCCLTGTVIQGPAFFLEDGRSAASVNDILMWAKLNPFSPLGTGIRINPF